MTPEAFISKWSQTTTKERAAAQEHFIDLCSVLGEKTPNEADPNGEWYAFEKGVQKTGAGRGWADVWKRGHFGWEYKSKSGGGKRTMSDALKQLQLYSLALESPPLLVVSDIDTIEIHTAFQNAVQEVHLIELAKLNEPENMARLRALFSDPEKLKPSRTRNQITTEAAGQFALLADELRADGHHPLQVAHFVNRILFCMFSEDTGMLKTGIFTSIAEKGVEHPEHFDVFIKRLFQAMEKGGPFGTEIIDWFNGGLYNDDETLPLNLEQIRRVRDLANMDWSQIEPAIFGTLFERGLDPDKRSQLGAHYTDAESIMRLVNPTIVEPLVEEWNEIKLQIADNMSRMEKVKTKAAANKRRRSALNLRNSFLERLRGFRVLDPACGSGNFLYMSLLALKDIEHMVNIESEAMGLERQNPLVDPENVLGIELSRYAAELARVTVWIGEIQWMLNHGYQINRKPILKQLETIEQRDAIINSDGTEPTWPIADVIIGNPPFLGDRKMIGELGETYVNRLRALYHGRVPGGADLVVYWFEKSLNSLMERQVCRVGLVATNSIRGGANRIVSDRITEMAEIFNAWSDEEWINEGAAVRVSLLSFARKTEHTVSFKLDGKAVVEIYADLTGKTDVLGGADITKAKKLLENQKIAFIGTQKNGAFDISRELVRDWLKLPNPNGKPNSDVLFRWLNGKAITGQNPDKWVIDFDKIPKNEAALYEAPFEYVVQHVKPTRVGLRRNWHRNNWWLHGDPRPAMKAKIGEIERYVITPRVSKHRVYIWADKDILPDSATVAFAKSDWCFFGVIHSRFHEVWSLAKGTSLEDRPRYTPSSTFDTFPFPNGLTPNLTQTEYSNDFSKIIAQKAKYLVAVRDKWLYPDEWFEDEPEEVQWLANRQVPKKEYAKELKTRTLTNLYNARPTWLRIAHEELDESVAGAYGWNADISDDDIFNNLLELNLARAGQQSI